MSASGVSISIPASSGIGLRTPHYRDMLESLPNVGFLEVHSENYFAEGGLPHYFLRRLREHYPLSLHGVGMSLGSSGPLDMAHLDKLKKLVEVYQPGLVSEHLSWGSIHGWHLNDLLPLPYTQETLDHVISKVGQVQDYLGRQILIENISTYLEFSGSEIPEWEFLAELSMRSGCGILLDINNLHVNAVNHGSDAWKFIAGILPESVGEIHLAGFSQGDGFLIDTHGKPVHDEVWKLYRFALSRLGRVPTLIEWDTDIPSLQVLLGEAAMADQLLNGGTSHAVAA